MKSNCQCRTFSNEELDAITRVPSHYNSLDTFRLGSGQDRHYQQQYGDMYFLRLAKLKPAVEEIAVEAWEGFSVRPIASIAFRNLGWEI